MYRPKRRGRLLLLVFLALSILLITLDFRGGSGGPLERAKDITAAIVAPIQRGVTAITRPIGNFFSSLGDLANLREENGRLEAELESISTEINEARNLQDENEELRAVLELDEGWASMERVTAQIIADSPGNYVWAVVIDRGSADGIRRNMAVISPEGLVGKILEVEENESTVLLLIDPNLGAGATTDGRGLTGVVSGNGEGQDLSLEFVSKEEDVRVGDEVVTSNFTGRIFPPGIPIGYVSRVGGDPRSADFDIDVNPYVEFKSLNFLVVLLETGETLPGEPSP